ncbi:MAG: LuxR C-terminal-related transcriptional regulator [Alphaproteobacteria bacterium]|nr:LuxR C-terminal-related transcriptional regulator [Alphaproteobacteria bacterium]
MRESEVLDLIYGVVADPGRWPDVLTGVSDRVGAIGGVIANSAVSGKSFLTLGRLSAEFGDLYQQRHTSNCWCAGARYSPPGQVVIANSLVDEQALRRTEFYADILVPQGIVNALGANHATMMENGGVGGFAFMLSERGNEKAEQRRKELQHLLPHLHRAFDACMQIGHYRHHGPQLEMILEAMPQAAFLLDRRARMLHANTSGEALLQSGEGLFYQNGELAAAPPFNTVLKRWLEVGQDTAESALLWEPLRLERPSGKPALIVMLVPLPAPPFPFWALQDNAQLLLLVADPVSERLAAMATVEKAFGLTSAQARVAVLVGAGFTAPQAAAALGLSLPTVKSHLARSFEKIGVNSQAGLVRAFASLPCDPQGRWPGRQRPRSATVLPVTEGTTGSAATAKIRTCRHPGQR